jgi:ABC-type branched-subunit amino acid transport system substrate-binding protein
LYFVDHAPTTAELWPYPDAPSMVTHSFFAQYAQANPGVVVSGAAMAAYDAVMVLARAAPARPDPTPGVVRDAVRAGLNATCGAKAWRGATGVVSFDAYGDPVDKLLVMRQFNRTAPSPVVARMPAHVGPVPACA